MITFEHLNLMCQSATVPSPAPLGTTPLPSIGALEEDYLSIMSSEISIQTVPFPFDLMRLLPKCQQVELLFSTYIQEFSPNTGVDHPRSTTVTADVRAAPNTKSQLSPDPVSPSGSCPEKAKTKTPNTLLFSQFLDSLKGVHDREINLTDFECEQLVSLIQQRERDLGEYPLPFSQQETTRGESMNIHEADESKDMDRHSEGGLSLATNLSMGSATHSLSTFASQSFTTGSQRLASAASTATQVTSPVVRDFDTDSMRTAPITTTSKEQVPKPAELIHSVIPRWRCFVRSLTSTHIMLCFVPATFCDLLLLVDTNDMRERQSKRGSLSSKSSMGGMSQSFSAESKSLDRTEPLSPHSDGQSIPAKTDQQVNHAEHTETDTPEKEITQSNLQVDTEGGNIPESVEVFSNSEKPVPVTAVDADTSEVSLDQEQSQELPTLTADWSSDNVPGPCPDVPKDYMSVNLPCYIYNCPLSFLSEQLVNKWTFKRPGDIYEDLTFKDAEGHRSGVSEKSGVGERSGEGEKLEEDSPGHRQRRISELELGCRQPEDVYQNAKELKQHCTMVSETFLRCFVKGLYQSLQQGSTMDCHDIDAAINEICEESLPLEIDISRFLNCSCGHVRQILERANLEHTNRVDLSKTQPKLISKTAEDETGEEPVQSEEPEPRSVLQIPLHLPLEVLKSPVLCEAAPNLHQLIRSQFELIVHHFFKPVQTNPDFYYFTVPCVKNDLVSPRDDIPETEFLTQDLTTDRGIVLTQTKSDNVAEVKQSDLSDTRPPEHTDKPAMVDNKVSLPLEHKGTFSGDSTIMYDMDVPSPRDMEEAEESIVSNKNSMSTLSGMGDDDLDDLDDAELESSRLECQPLFVHLTCSVRAKNCPLRSMPVRNLPVCFNEIEECLRDLESTIDLDTVRVTLDIICLTLPPEEDLSENFHRPCYTRMMSHTSQLSYNSSSAQDDGPDLDESISVTTDGGLMQRSMGGDPLRHLPATHKEAVTRCKDQILWLLCDEITSIMRSIVPVTRETLEMVTNHIKASDEKPMCNTKHVLLKFVGGAEHSLHMFIENFERMNLPGFHMHKEGTYYYLSLDRAYGYTQAHARALQTALSHHLDYPDINQIALMAAMKKDHEADCVEVILPDTANIDVSQVKISGTEDTEGPGLTEDTKAFSAFAKNQLSTEKETETFRAEDITISVTRPSPVKELPKKEMLVSDLNLMEGKHEGSGEGLEKGYASDKSSGSSIQVLDDKIDSEQVIKDQQVTSVEEMKKVFSRDFSMESIEGEIVKPADDVVDKQNKSETSSDGLSKSRHTSDCSGSRHSSGGKTHDVRSPSGGKSDGSTTTRGLSPLTVLGMDTERKGIRRAHSSASFEKYRHEKAKISGKGSQPETPGQSGWSTPQRASSGHQTPSRSRHHSGLDILTPMSTIETSSCCSVADDGYDGDSSDLDEDGAMMSFNETQTFTRPILPDFWLIMKIENDRVNVFFHTRDTGDNPERIVNYKKLYNQMIAEIIATCRIVNQKMLLEVLYSTRMCDKLLVPEADEEVCWGKDTQYREKQPNRQDHDSEDSDAEGQEKVYFDAARDTDPGHFACDCVWQTNLMLHPRLKTGRANMSREFGIQTLRSSVLNKFSVSNRNNMFVIKENSTGAVFYLRLEETPGDAVSVRPSDSQKPEEDWSASRSSSMLSLNIKRMNEPEDDQSGLMSPRRSAVFDRVSEAGVKPVVSRERSEDIITLSAHGICPVGPEISKDLKELLQKKLDDAVLKVLTEIIFRNPMCKLTPDDVQFIQRPNTRPRCRLAYTIPPSTLLQQFALSYYLQQNLLQFVHTPKYMDPGQDEVFMDYTQIPATPMHEDYVFLYIRPQQSGGNGIWCLYLSFVDSSGQPVQLISSPKPSPLAYRDHVDTSMFDSLVHTEQYKLREQGRSPTKSPGPMALVQFTVWAQGTIDIPSLSDQLQLAVKHAVADVVTEYRLLTAPICEVPTHYNKGLDTPIYSAPPSPGRGYNAVSQHGTTNEIKKQISEGGEKTPKDKMSFSIHSLVSDIFHKGKDKDEPENTGQTSTWQEVEGERRRRQELREKIQKYEGGEKGTLVPMFYTTLQDWYHFCHQLKVPAVHLKELRLSNRFPLDYILKDMVAAISNISQDILARVFKEVLSADGECIYLPYIPSRSPVGNRDRTFESTLDLANLHSRNLNLPGFSCSYVLIGRNSKQWRASIDYGNNGEEMSMELPSLTNPRTHKSYQRYKPLEPENSSERPEAGGVTSIDRHDRAFVPRQRLIMITVKDKQLTLYLYNWANELCTSLERQLLRYVQWHNARSQVLLGIFSQKMGLYQHNPLKGIAIGDLLNAHTEPNPFSQSHSEMDLIRYNSPPSQPTPQSRSRPASGHSSAIAMDEVYRDTKPAHPMHKSGYYTLRDPIHRHGAQLLEHWSFVKKENEKKMDLQKIYLDWQQRIIPNMHIPDDVLDLLKKSSRLIHTVATPMLFSPQWRKKILGKKDPPKHVDAAPDTSKLPRSRHSSGASVKSRRSSSIDGRWHTGIDSPDLSSRSSSGEECWHQELKDRFLRQYSLYLQDLGIHLIKTAPRSIHKRFSGHRPTGRSQPDKTEQTSGELKTDHLYLQKTLPGGIMLVEIGFSEEYFCVNVYAFEVSSLPVSKNVKSQLAVMFTEECEKFKDQTRAHSFSHNFHLSTLLQYIHGRHQGSFKKSNYHVTGFLKDFVQQYPTIPTSAQNFVYEGRLVIEDTNSSSQQLFDYMLQHDKLYDMRSIKMLAHPDDLENDECALVMKVERPTLDSNTDELLSKINPQDYYLGLIIAHDSSHTSFDNMCLRLKFWVILVNEKLNQASSKPERKRIQSKVVTCSAEKSNFCGQSRAPVNKDLSQCSLEPSLDQTDTQTDTSDADNLTTSPLNALNYLGFSNSHQAAGYELLMTEVHKASECIQQMVKRTMTHCRRDVLWQRMILGEMAEEEGRRKRHKTGEVVELRDPLMTKLTSHEFQEMLTMVNKVHISEFDPQLKPLENMPPSWYQGLGKVLTQKYCESLRSFCSTDGIVQYYVVLNPKQLDMLMMLSVDMLGDSDLFFVYKEQEDQPKSETAMLVVLDLLETFINTCCYHMWTGLV